MTRARFFALALLIGACSGGAAPAFAQSGMPGGAPGMYGAPGQYPPGPYQNPLPVPAEPQLFTDSEDCLEGSAAYQAAPVFDHAFLRVEYLHFNIKDPGNVTLGAPVKGVTDETQPFYVYEPGTSNVNAVGYVPTTFPVALSDINGVRATLGLELTYGGSFEIGAFFLGKKSSGFNITSFPEQVVTNPGDPLSAHIVTQDVATTLLDHGQIGSLVLLYNQSYSLTYTSQLWGAEGNFIGDYDRDGLFQLNPILGVRYFNLSERMTQRGVYKDTVLDLAPITTTIDSLTTNNLYGGQIGGRLELVTKYIQMGIDPKLLFLGNTMYASVATEHLRSNADGVYSTNDQTTGFSFGVDLSAYAAINFTERFSVRVGYTFIWLNAVTRPYDNIYYNSNGLDNPPAVTTKLDRQDFVVHGVSVGGELKF